MADLSTLETRLQEALELGSAGATSDTDLASAARARAGARRRRRWVAAGATAGLALVLGVAPLVVDDLRSAEVPPATEDVPRDERRGPPSGWHEETWNGVTVQVPNTWGSGALSEWCRRGELLGTPAVERPGDRRADRCPAPALGYGVQFLGPGRSARIDSQPLRRPRAAEVSLFPRDAWVGVTCGDCRVAVRVVAPDRLVGKYLLDSYEVSPEAQVR